MADQQADTASQQSEGIDFGQELQEQVEKFEQADHNREGFARRTASRTEEGDKTQDVASVVQAEIQKLIPQLQSTIAADSIETKINSLSNNPDERKLIKHIFENQLAPIGSITERLENAKLLARRRVYLKQESELTLSQQNREQMATSAQAQSQESSFTPPGDNMLSAAQIAGLKARGWDDKKIERFKVLAQKSAR